MSTGENLIEVIGAGKMLRIGLCVLCLLSSTFAMAAVENDGPGAAASQNQASPKKLLAASGSSFTPPKASDVQFVVTSGGDLGVTAGSGYPTHTIKIPLNIERVFGDRDILIENGGLPDHVTLRMIVWDVDSDSSYSPAEFDEVYVNGKKVGTLSGHNQIWTDNTFSVPTKYLNLKSSSSDSGNNTVQVNVDVKNGGWITKVDWISVYIPAPPPVVVAHGIRSNAGSMMMLRTAIQGLGLPVHAFSFANQGNDGIASGAAEVAREVANAKRDFNVESVNIVAHSMGGLKSRHYVENLTTRDVLHLFQIATPNAGSPLADWLVAKRDYIKENWWDWVGEFADSDFMAEHALIRASDPAADELTVAYMRRYNANHHLNPNVRYSVIAGSVEKSSISAWDLSTKFFYDLVAEQAGPNDTIVPVSSARALSMQQMGTAPGSVKLCEHSALVNDGVSISLAFGRSELLERKVMKDNVATGEQKTKRMLKASSLLAKTSGLKDPGMAFQIGEAPKGELTEIKFNVLSGNETTGEMNVLNSNKMNVRLKSPSNLIFEGNAENVEMISTTNKLNFCLLTPEVGEWTIELTPLELGNVAKSACLYMFSLIEENVEINMGVKLDRENVKVGENFIAMAQPTFEGSTVVGTITAIIKAPGGDTESIELKDDGIAPDIQANDGLYAAYIPTHDAGSYQMTMKIDAESPVKFSRYSVLSGVAASSYSEVNGVEMKVLDDDNNGYYDELVAEFNVQCDRLGLYRVVAVLSDEFGGQILEASSGDIECDLGSKKINVLFDGESIYQHGESSRYVVSSAKLIEVSDSYEAVVDEKENLVTTSNWKYDQFEHSALWIGAGGSEIPTDTNGDGIYDILNVKIPLVSEGSLSGNYQWSAALVDGDGLVMGFTSGSVNFPAGGGTSQISLTYNGPDIALSGSDGPYYVKNFIFWGNNDTFSLPGQFATRAYKIQQWGGTPKSTETPIVKADVKWAYNVSSDSFFAQLNLSCTNGTPSQIGSLRYLFEERTSPVAYLCDKAGRKWTQTITESSENTSFDGRTFYYVDIDLPELKTADLGTVFTYGVQANIPDDGIVDRVPADERKIGLWIAGRDTLVNKATTEIANDYLGWLSWDANGKTNYIAVGNSALQTKILRTPLLATPKSVPPSVETVNRAVAFGSSVLMDGSDPSCEITEFSVVDGMIKGRVELVADDSTRTVPGTNVKVTLYGAGSLADTFNPVEDLSLDGSGRFAVAQPTNLGFFRVKIEVLPVVE